MILKYHIFIFIKLIKMLNRKLKEHDEEVEIVEKYA